MCYSFEYSILTGTLAYGTIIYLWIRNANYRDRWNAIWMWFLGTMQWVDAYIWYLHDNGEDLSVCKVRNFNATYTALMVIMLEPFGNLCALMYASDYWYRPTYKTVFIYIMVFIVAPFFGKRYWSALEDPHCAIEWESYACASITDGVHIMYNVGMDSHGGHKCWMKYYFFGELQTEMPLIIRIAFLIGIIYPYRYSNPIGPGIINALIITLSWFLGYFSDAHASVWCWAASLQSIYFVFFDRYLFPTGFHPKITETECHARESKEGEEEKEREIKILQRQYTSKKGLSTEWDAIVIGSGIGGLSTAALMARSGRKVLVLEQHYRAGGCMHTFDEFGGEFDSGIHYVGTLGKAKWFLSFITSKAVEWYHLGSAPRSINGVYDKIDLDGNNDPEEVVRYRAPFWNLREELSLKFPDQKKQIKRYLKHSRNVGGRITDLLVLSKIFPDSFIFQKSSFIYKWYVQPHLKWTRRTANNVIKKFIDNPKLKAILGGGQMINWCLIPAEASWWVVAAMMNYYRDGGFYPKGGSNNISMSIIPVITENGGSVLCGAKVKQILVNNKTNSAYGVEMEESGDIIKAPLIISGVGAHTLFWELLPDDNEVVKQRADELRLLQKNGKLVPSLGHMTAFITFDGTAEELELPDYNIHSWNNLSKYNYNISTIQRLFYEDPIECGDEALVWLTFPSAKDPFYNIKFPNKSNALLLIEAKSEWFEAIKNDGQKTMYYKALKESFREMFMKRLIKYCPKVEDKIINFELGSSQSSEHFLNTNKGGNYGVNWSTHRFQHKYTKKFFHSKAARIRNLFITGESSMFGGFVGALLSGFVTSLKIMGWKQIIKILLCTPRVGLDPPRSGRAYVSRMLTVTVIFGVALLLFLRIWVSNVLVEKEVEREVDIESRVAQAVQLPVRSIISAVQAVQLPVQAVQAVQQSNWIINWTVNFSIAFVSAGLAHRFASSLL